MDDNEEDEEEAADKLKKNCTPQPQMIPQLMVVESHAKLTLLKGEIRDYIWVEHSISTGESLIHSPSLKETPASHTKIKYDRREQDDELGTSSGGAITMEPQNRPSTKSTVGNSDYGNSNDGNEHGEGERKCDDEEEPLIRVMFDGMKNIKLIPEAEKMAEDARLQAEAARIVEEQKVCRHEEQQRKEVEKFERMRAAEEELAAEEA
ncbi:hypothetical protein BJ508DRAFT_335774 [Ascobolus immersus RN42]|uniref:Uncharacterized protein n=1 Tax=Ascobolus immersus RN42 TaxID=1160509 RepID=A0A3N4HB88_ASCIM|nr:hypothetical protein BJ508DRAFT_335774 [Ascobolus immersus RN42]